MKNSNYKSVKELSNELNVSRQTIYNKINEIKAEIPKNKHSNYFKNIGNALNVKPKGIELIYSKLEVPYYEIGQEQKEKALINNNGFIDLSETIKVLEKQLKIKDEQLSEKDKQISSLLDTIKEQQEGFNIQLKTERERGYTKALETELKALKAGYKPLEPTNEENKSILKRITSFFKRN